MRLGAWWVVLVLLFGPYPPPDESWVPKPQFENHWSDPTGEETPRGKQLITKGQKGGGALASKLLGLTSIPACDTLGPPGKK